MVAAHQSPLIAIVAGEASGDLLGSHLIQSIRARLPHARFVGIAGPKMQSAGAETLFPMEKLAVRGYVEVLRHLREILRIRKELIRLLKEKKPDLFIGIDAPDFNLGVAKKMKAAGIPAIHYVSPSIWAWRSERIHKIGKAVSHVLTLFPFEKPLYDKAGIPATYVGHPLADELPMHPDRDAIREGMRISPTAKVVAILPGSRMSELEFMSDTFIESAKLIHERFPGTLFLVPLITRETRNYFESRLYTLGANELPFRLMFGHAHEAMIAADAVLVASGTASLEAALLKRPMVISYRLSPLTYRMVKPKMLLPYVGLPNVMAGRFLVPELLQEEATPENLAQALGNYLEDRELVKALQSNFQSMHETLRQNTAERATDAVMKFLRS